MMPPNQEARRHERLLLELAKHEGDLREWIERCSVNAMWYLSDPVGAMRSANLGIDEALLLELETLIELHRGGTGPAEKAHPLQQPALEKSGRGVVVGKCLAGMGNQHRHSKENRRKQQV